MSRYNLWQSRNHPAWWAFAVHRISGALLTLFLPLHFWALGQAIEGEARLQSFLAWTDNPLVKVAETGLVILLAAHLAGGLRLLAVELLPWHNGLKNLISISFGISLVVGLVFALNVH